MYSFETPPFLKARYGGVRTLSTSRINILYCQRAIIHSVSVKPIVRFRTDSPLHIDNTPNREYNMLNKRAENWTHPAAGKILLQEVAPTLPG